MYIGSNAVFVLVARLPVVLHRVKPLYTKN